MQKNNKYFFLPFASLLVYTFGAFFLFSFSAGGVFLSPGGSVIGYGSSVFVVSIILALVILMLILSIRKKRKEKNEQ